MFKKNKVKRSKWMEGLLYAEEQFQSGLEVRVYKSTHDMGLGKYWIITENKAISNSYRFPCHSDENVKGVADYIWYKEYLATSK